MNENTTESINLGNYRLIDGRYSLSKREDLDDEQYESNREVPQKEQDDN